MQTLREDHSAASWLVQHPLSAEDQAAMAAMRAMVEPNKGKLQGIAARVPFDAIMEHVSAPVSVVYEADRIGRVSGWRCRPENARPGQAVMWERCTKGPAPGSLSWRITSLMTELRYSLRNGGS